MNSFFSFNTANEQKFSKFHPAQTTEDKQSSYITFMVIAITAFGDYETKWGSSTRLCNISTSDIPLKC